MNQGNISSGFNSNDARQIVPVNLPVPTSFNKDNSKKACKYRTKNGFCTRIHRQCPATLFTIILNN